MIEYDANEGILARLEQENLQRYRNVFGSAEGRLVLGDILKTCHFGVPLNNDVERAEYNVGIAIARMSGAMEQVDRFLGMPPDHENLT